WTRLVIARDRPLRAVTGLITGLHEPRASHLAILEQAVAAARFADRRASRRVSVNRRARRAEAITAASECSAIAVTGAAVHLERAYAEARHRGYLWHEFGDAHLIIGRP